MACKIINPLHELDYKAVQHLLNCPANELLNEPYYFEALWVVCSNVPGLLHEALHGRSPHRPLLDALLVVLAFENALHKDARRVNVVGV